MTPITMPPGPEQYGVFRMESYVAAANLRCMEEPEGLGGSRRPGWGMRCWHRARSFAALRAAVFRTSLPPSPAAALAGEGCGL